jgi:hypothetical protein
MLCISSLILPDEQCGHTQEVPHVYPLFFPSSPPLVMKLNYLSLTQKRQNPPRFSQFGDCFLEGSSDSLSLTF